MESNRCIMVTNMSGRDMPLPVNMAIKPMMVMTTEIRLILDSMAIGCLPMPRYPSKPEPA